MEDVKKRILVRPPASLPWALGSWARAGPALSGAPWLRVRALGQRVQGWSREAGSVTVWICLWVVGVLARIPGSAPCCGGDQEEPPGEFGGFRVQEGLGQGKAGGGPNQGDCVGAAQGGQPAHCRRLTALQGVKSGA